MRVKEVKKKKKLMSSSCKVTEGNCLFSAWHTSFQSRTAHVILGCLPLTIATWPKLSAEVNYSWSEPFHEMYPLDTGWERVLLPVRSQPIRPSPLCVGRAYVKSQNRAKKRGKTHGGTEPRPVSALGCCAEIYDVYCFVSVSVKHILCLEPNESHLMH